MNVKNPHTRVRLRRIRRHRRVRARLAGTADRPRLSVFRSARAMAAQVIDDAAGRTLCAAREGEVVKANSAPFEGRAGKVARAYAVGQLVAERAKAAGITAVVFDRGGYAYHGRVRALAEGARAGGLLF